ncbi:MAG: hypothetical protein JWO27_627 [Frankiales bacterium]|nr:hypothetical protein [Frankiales bacterium]MCW2706410.1 hypothetical protein [Frankiales bacterium]
MADPERGSGDRRNPGTERRTYNRRSAPDATPPYYEAFERIAAAIERIGLLLEQKQVRLPDTGTSAVPPRTSPEQKR